MTDAPQALPGPGFRVPAWSLWVAVALAGLLSLAVNWKLHLHGDDFFQVAAGLRVLSHGFPRTDFISWLSVERGYGLVGHEWLYQVTAALVHRAAGFAGLGALMALAATANYALIARLAWLRTRDNGTALVVLLLSVLALTADYAVSFQMRPQTLTLTLLLAAAVLMESGGRWRWLVPLVPVVLAANWQGGYWPVFVLVFAYYAARERDARLLLPLAGFLANPYGAAILALTAAYGGSTATYAGLIPEWARTTLWPAESPVQFASYALVLAALGLGRPRREDTLLALAFLLLGLAGLRYTILLPVIAYPLLAPAIGATLVRAGGWLHGLGISGRGLRTLASGGLGILLLAAVASGSMAAATIRPNDETVPALDELVSYARSHGIVRVFNTEMLNGGYLYSRGLRPMYDNRTDVYLHPEADGETAFGRYVEALASARGLRELLGAYGVTHVLASNDGRGSDPVAELAADGELVAVASSGKYTLYEWKGRP